MPPPNDRRRAQLADAAIALLAETGVHGTTHRAVDARAGLPAGTASNYFRSREALLIAAVRRVGALHRADMAAAAATHQPRGDTRQQVIELIAGSLHSAATTDRGRYLAIFELRMESLRRPALADALTELADLIGQFTVGHHALLDLAVPPAAVPLLLTLYGGALFTLVSEPAGTVTADATRQLAAAIVAGALAAPP